MTYFTLKLPTLAWIIASSLTGLASANSDPSTSFNLTESEYLALEGGAMLPYPEDVSKVERGLSMIREKFEAIKEIKHNRKWIPGQVLTTQITKEQIALVNNSAYGPLKHVEKIDVMPFFFVTVLTFKEPYSPPVLAKALQQEFEFPCSPNTVYYEYEVDNISYRMSNSSYIFKRGTGVCKENCSDRYLWEFQVNENNEPQLVQEWVVPQNGERVLIHK